MKRLGKKGKDEAARLEAELAARHAAELAALDSGKEKTAAEAVAVADSLYSVHLGADGEEQQEGQHKVGAAAWAACARHCGDAVRCSAAAACAACGLGAQRCSQRPPLAHRAAPLPALW